MNESKRINRILVATNGSDSSRYAVALGGELASAEGAELTFLHVVPPVEFVAGRMSLHAAPRLLRSVGDEALDAAALAADELGVRSHRELVSGDVHESIVAYADAIDADLVVVGERQRRRRFGLTVARWVARNSTRPVLVARPPVAERVAA